VHDRSSAAPSSPGSADRLAAVGAGLALALSGLYAGNNPDTFGHLAQGRQILELGRVPELDGFSLLEPARPFVNYEWLTDLVYALLERHFGYDGLLGLKCVLLALTGYVLCRLATRLAGTHAALCTALVLVSTIPAVRVRLSDRPHVLGIALAAFGLVLGTRLHGALEAGEHRRALAWGAASFALQALWVNVHGSHLLGTFITVAFLVGGAPVARRPFALLLGSHALAACLSPYGPRIVLDAIAHVFDPRYRALVTEWQAWKEADAPWLQLGPALHAALITLLAPRLVRSAGPLRALALVAAGLAVGSFRSIRFIAEFMLLSSPLLGAAVATRFGEQSRRFALALGPLVCALSVWGAAQLPPLRGFGHGAFYRDRPHGAGTWLASALPGARVFATMDDGWFLMWELPKARFVVDGRATFYGPEYLADTARAFDDPRVLVPRLEADAIDAVVVRFTQAQLGPLVAAMERHPRFARVLVENDHVTYVRTQALGTRAPLEAQTPSYDLAPLVADAKTRAALARDRARLAQLPNTEAVVAFGSALDALAPLVRAGAHDGLRTPTSPVEWSRLAQARALLETARGAAPHVPSVAALSALVHALSCELAEAEAELAEARAEGDSRETLFTTQELALRAGSHDAVARFVALGQRDPRARGDAWLSALSASVGSTPACPTPP
jgi:hypothetical protein